MQSSSLAMTFLNVCTSATIILCFYRDATSSAYMLLTVQLFNEKGFSDIILEKYFVKFNKIIIMISSYSFY